MNHNGALLVVALSTLVAPPCLAWRHAAELHRRVESARASLAQTRTSVQTIASRREMAAPGLSGSFGQADAVRLVNAALIEAGLSPAAATELALRDDTVRRQGRNAGRLQQLTVRLAPLETPQLGRVTAALGSALPGFTAAEITLTRPGGLDETDTRIAADLAYEREYAALEEVRTP
jgi:hypothetical protein